MYDSFSSDYDRFVNWPSRLAFEVPFLQSHFTSLNLQPGKPGLILDTATGTGMHVLELRRLGYIADGCDISQGMVDRARANAAEAKILARFEVAGFGEIRSALKDALPYDALLCLGNSLPHLPDLAEIEAALNDFAACLRPGGMIIIQNRNFDSVIALKERWMEPQTYRDGDQEWIFLRFYDFEADGMVNFHVMTLHKNQSGAWQQKVVSTRLFPILQGDLLGLLRKCLFKNIECFGGMNGSEFDPKTSGNLVITATLQE
jgi:glycine/sarcosine N-methyltransferase